MEKKSEKEYKRIKVKKISVSKNENVYDLTAPKNHNFFANKILVHNCQEFIGLPFMSCNLGSINLTKMIENKRFNWDLFKNTIIEATRFLNNVIDVNVFPLPEIEKMTKATRPIGIGVMGLAEAFYKKDIPYNSDKAIKLTEEFIRYITLTAMQESIELAKISGPYEAFDYDLFMKVNERLFTKSCRDIDIEKLKKDIKKHGVRNSALTAIAPTGSISFIADTTGGIEPCFALSYIRKIEKQNKDYEEVIVNMPTWDEYIQNTFNDIEKGIIAHYIEDHNGSCQGCELIPKEIQKIFVVAGDLTPMEHLDILEVAANNVSLSVSKTINLPKDIAKEKISEVFLEAHKRGIIGVTVYRDGSRKGILVHKNNTNENKIKHCGMPKRPKKLPCHVYKINTLNRETKTTEKWVVFVGLMGGEPYEVFAGKINLIDLPSNITEGYITKMAKRVYQFEHNGEVIVKDITKIFESGTEEALTRVISGGLQSGLEPEWFFTQLNKVNTTIVDFNKAIARAFKKYLKNHESDEVCPQCNTKLVYKEGCIGCPTCGWSKC
jgi:ribonucleoside-diphosphate reductase alpha chain